MDFPVLGMDHVRFAVGNAKQAAHYYSTAFGMRWSRTAGPETGSRDLGEYVLEAGAARFLLTGEAHGGHLGRRARRASTVTASSTSRSGAGRARPPTSRRVAAGATPLAEPTVSEDEHGKVVIAAIATYGQTRHTFVQRDDYSGVFLPGFVPRGAGRRARRRRRSRRSTTASATSSSAGWTSGSASTTGSWASRT